VAECRDRSSRPHKLPWKASEEERAVVCALRRATSTVHSRSTGAAASADQKPGRHRVQVRQVPRLGRKVAVTHRGPGRCHAGSADLMAHHLVRLVVAPGHEVRLMSPEYVRPRVEAQKNDGRDAEGLAGAATRPTMWFVA
jgi:transposase